MNLTNLSTTIPEDILFNENIRLMNLILLCTGFLFNLCLFCILLLIGRRECTTYFLLTVMTLCDCSYCAVHLSIILTVDQHINLINHQILCPLSFFLTPFTYTGSTLLLLICLLHFITHYVRKYDTTLGQIGGRLSVVFVLAFSIIRSVLGSTSVELITLDPNAPDVQFCTIDMNISPVVRIVQSVTHIFSEMTDILVYLGWLIIVMIYFINLIRCKPSYFDDEIVGASSSLVKPFSYISSVIVYYNKNSIDRDHQSSIVEIPLDSMDALNCSNETSQPPITNKQRHRDLSLIVFSIGFMSICLYLPMILSKYSTMCLIYFQKFIFNQHQTQLLQILQHICHLFCLSLRFLPYLLFDRRLHLFIHQLIGMKCFRNDRRKRCRRERKRRYIWNFRFQRRKNILTLNSAEHEQENNR